MARDQYTRADISAVEDQMRDSLENLRQIRNKMADGGVESIELNFGTVQFYSTWIQRWTGKTLGQIDATMKAKTVVNKIRERKKSEQKHKAKSQK